MLITLLLISNFDEKMVVRFYIKSKSDIENIMNMGMTDITSVNLKKGYADFVINKFQYEKVKNLYSHEVLFDGSEMKTLINFGPYYTYSEAMNEINKFHLNYPNLVSQPFIVGLSWENRQIKGIKVSANNNIKPAIWFNSAIHAREPGGVSALLGFTYYLLKNYYKNSEINYLLNNRDIYVIPVTNPDGYVFNESYASGLWRKNKRDNNNNGVFETNYDGVDLNRNFGYMWGCCNGSSPNPSSETYRGPSPFSEPETQSYRNFFNQVKPVIANDIHTYSNLIIWPWGYTSTPTPDDSAFRALAWRMFRYNAYNSFQAYYLYVTDGTSDDWIYGATNEHPKSLGFTFEIGESFYQPDTNIILEQVGENIFPFLYLVKAGGPFIEISNFSYIFSGDTVKISISGINLGFNSPISGLYAKLEILDNVNAIGIDTIVYIGNLGSLGYGFFNIPNAFKFISLNNCKNYKVRIIFYNNSGFIQPVEKFIAGQKVIVLEDDFNNNSNWQVNGGTWVFSNGYLRTNQQGTLYNNNLNTDVRLLNPLNTSSYDYLEAIIIHRWRLEGNYNVLNDVYDFASLDFSDDNRLFIPVKRFWGNNINFRSDTFDITHLKTSSLYMRFKFYSDGADRDSGWVIDKIQILGANSCNISKREEYLFSDFSKINFHVSKGKVILNIPYKSSVKVRIYTIDGKVIFDSDFLNRERINIDLNKKGVFVLYVKTQKETIRERILVF
ncbi:MAG: M14 family zinc carboxypeptidase [candidate division WOR-3 bacterium]|nr:M14 family zinc carboxypeptidase [candidate division WOR-3 bacterium]